MWKTIFLALSVLANGPAPGLRSSTIEGFSIDAAGEQVCQTIDLNSEKNSPFQKMKIYEQTEDDCFAVSAAQLVDYYRIKHNDFSYGLTNPTYTAWNDHFGNVTLPYFRGKSTLDGGDDESAINSLRAQGACSAQDSQNILTNLKTGQNMTDNTLMEYLKNMHDHHGFMSLMTTDEINDYVAGVKTAGGQCDVATNMAMNIKRLGLWGKTPMYVLKGVFDKCQKHAVNVPKPDVVGTSDGDIQQAILNSLKNHEPAGLTLCSSVFNGQSYRGLDNNRLPLSEDGCGMHALLVAGQASIGGKCQYLIRNSFGTDWNPPTASSCSCLTKSHQYKEACLKSEIGQTISCWVPAKDILANTNHATTLQ